jgi:AraC-like DNA-binding protein
VVCNSDYISRRHAIIKEIFLVPDTSEELYISYFGHQACPPKHFYGPAVRDHFLFVYVIQGRGEYMAEGRKYTLTGGQSFILFPNVLTTYEADEMEPWEYIWIGFFGMKASEIMMRIGLSPASPVLSHRRPERIAQLIGGLMSYESVRDECLDKLFYSGSLNLLLAQVVADKSPHLPEKTEIPADTRIAQAQSFIKQHFDKSMDITTVARHVGLERSYFTKRFKAITGISPYEYLLQLRLSKGKQLLEQTDMAVDHIALLLGFNDGFHFSNFFRHRTGTSPAKYRTEMKHIT